MCICDRELEAQHQFVCGTVLYKREPLRAADTTQAWLAILGEYRSVYSRFAPIFRLLLKVAVDRAHQCDSRIFGRIRDPNT